MIRKRRRALPPLLEIIQQNQQRPLDYTDNDEVKGSFGSRDSPNNLNSSLEN
jgi:hypothetical protein